MPPVKITSTKPAGLLAVNNSKFMSKPFLHLDGDELLGTTKPELIDHIKQAYDEIFRLSDLVDDERAAISGEIEERVIAAIRSRRDAGRAKYGTTMERKDLSFIQWVQHLQEELLDAAIYAEKLKDDRQDHRTVMGQGESIDDQRIGGSNIITCFKCNKRAEIAATIGNMPACYACTKEYFAQS